uniref:Uncharacterized protein n=1 Tax=Romanomermis culicivorax TaxID=13658 RepID=A0A915JNP8_ROMCU
MSISSPLHSVNFHYISVDEDWLHRTETDDGAVAREYVEFVEHFLRVFDTVRVPTNLQSAEEDVVKFLSKKTSVTAATQTTSVSTTSVLHRSF